MIRIDDNYVVCVDGYNYVLKRDAHRTAKVKDNDDEQPVYVTIGYYGNFKAALERMLQEDIREKLVKRLTCDE